MRLGITVFLTDQGIDPATLAREVEQRGFDGLYVPEHTHLPVRNATPPSLVEGVRLEDYRRSLDPWVALAMAAAGSERIRLGTGVALVAQHDPIVLAKQIATLDHLSGGRVTLGVGYGWNRDELEDHGVAYDERRQVVADHLVCMQALWSQDEATHDGPYTTLEASYSWPKPRQQPRVRTLLGGGAGPKLFEAIAAHADGWMPIGGAGLGESLPRLRAAFEAVGRDPADIEVMPFGTVPTALKLDRYRELGCTEVVLRVPMGTTDEVRRSLDDLRRWL
jgi:probable F420-dependent oxidoreductase